MQTIAIVGCGFSGLAVALQLARHSIPTVLIDDSPTPGLGVAYASSRREHLLNVPAARMSAFHDDPDHLLRWLSDHGHACAPTDFIPRMLYGTYLRSLLHSLQSNGLTQVRRGRCVSLTVNAEGVTLTLSRGDIIQAHAAVLALGNSTPPTLPVSRSGTHPSMCTGIAPRIVQNPWSHFDTHEALSDDRVAIIGTGLTAIDVILTLDALGHRGPITAISRRGLLPQPHQPATPPATQITPCELIAGRSPRAALRAVREACEAEARCGGDWRTILDGLRPSTAEAWAGWSLSQREAFLRHIRPYWDAHRHRMPPAVAERIQTHIATGRLHVQRGRLERIEATPTGITIHSDSTDTALSVSHALMVDLLINCTGPSTNPTRWRDPLIDHLIEQGFARVDPLGLGLESDRDGRLLAATPEPACRLFTIGPLRRPQLWESTAVPEIRAQASALAHVLLNDAFTASSSLAHARH